MIAASVARLQSAVDLIRTVPDASTPDGRAKERMRRVVFSAGAAAMAKVVSMVGTLVLLPIVLNHLGAERFGIWITITSFLALMAFMDLGIGNGLVTSVAHASGRGDTDELRQLISSAVVALSAIAAVLVLALVVAYGRVPWAAWLGVHASSAADEVPLAIAVFGACLAVSIPASIAGRVQFGLQQGYRASLFQIVGTLASLIGTLLALHVGAGLPMLVAAAVGAPAVASLVNSFVFFGVWRRDLQPTVKCFSGRVLKSVLSSGAVFFVLQVALSVGMATDNLILSRILGPEFVAQYAIPAKLFGLISIATGMAINPLWPAYGEAVARGDSGWVRRTLLRSMVFVVVVGLAGVAVLAALLPTILDLWVGGKVVVPAEQVLAFAIWTVIECWGGSVAMYLNGTKVLRIQFACATAFAMACLGARIVMVESVGIAGIPLGAAAAFLITTAIPYVVFLWIRLRSQQ
jgi:O-antigen/teichoic acid export membrane protein